MSVTSVIDSLRKKRTPFAIWKKTSSPTTWRAVSDNILRYLDETRKPSENALGGKPVSELKEGIGYLTKEEKGRLRVYGFLRDDIREMSGQDANSMENDALVQQSHTAWAQRLKRKKIKRLSHNYVLSLHPDLCRVLPAMGKSADELLVNTARNVMRKYQSKYYPEDRISYLLGVHHDKDHIHAHLMLFPTTDKGKLLRVTDESAARNGRKPFQMMRELAQKTVDRWVEREIESPPTVLPRSNDNPMRYWAGRLLSYAALKEVQKRPDLHPGDESITTKAAQCRRKFAEQGDEQIEMHLKNAIELQVQWHDKYYDQSKSDGQIRDEIQSLFEDRKKCSANLSDCREQLKKLHADDREAEQRRAALIEDMRGWKYWKRSKVSVFAVGGQPEPRAEAWLRMRSAREDELGAHLASVRAVQETNGVGFAKRSHEAMDALNIIANPRMADRYSSPYKDELHNKVFCSYYGRHDREILAMRRFLKAEGRVGTLAEDAVELFLKAEREKQRDDDLIRRQKKQKIYDKMAAIRLANDRLELEIAIKKSVQKSLGKQSALRRAPEYIVAYLRDNNVISDCLDQARRGKGVKARQDLYSENWKRRRKIMADYAAKSREDDPNNLSEYVFDTKLEMVGFPGLAKELIAKSNTKAHDPKIAVPLVKAGKSLEPVKSKPKTRRLNEIESLEVLYGKSVTQVMKRLYPDAPDAPNRGIDRV